MLWCKHIFSNLFIIASGGIGISKVNMFYADKVIQIMLGELYARPDFINLLKSHYEIPDRPTLFEFSSINPCTKNLRDNLWLRAGAAGTN